MGVRTATNDPFQEAQAYFTAGNFRRCREVALHGLEEHPDDVNLLKLAAKSSLQLNLDDAATTFQKVVNLAPDDVEAWHELGDALVEQGELTQAAGAFREALRLRPGYVTALVDLGHTVYALGTKEEAIEHLSEAAHREPGNLTTLRSLVDMYRRTDRLEEALATAQQIVDLQPDDVLATMDVAELSLALNRLDDAVAAYGRLRHIDTEEEHEVYAYHGMIQVEMQRDRWRRVLDLAIDATRVDRYGVTTELLAFAVAQVFGSSERPTPSRAEIDASLAAEQAEHRRLHTEAIAF